MTNTSKVLEGIPAPGLPDVKLAQPFDNIYVLYYLKGSHHPQEKRFHMEGEFRDIIERVKDYCTKMSYRFLRVEPFLNDLTKDIQWKMENDR